MDNESILSRLKGLKILYVEDELLMRENIASVLRMYCDDVRTSNNGYDGYNLFLQMEPNIVITDIEMMGLNGLELAAMIRKRDNKCKIIITTAYTDTDLLLKASELNLTKYLVKPISSEKLFEALKISIEQMQTRKSIDSIKLGEECTFTKSSRSVKTKGVDYILTNNEFELLNELSRNIGTVIPKEVLINIIWRKREIGEESLRTLVKNIKKKIPKTVIKNIKGVGYFIPHSN